MKIVLDSHRSIRSGGVSPKLPKNGSPVALEVYSVEEAKKDPSVQGELVANCDTLDFRPRIYTVRGVQVMLDRDLASAYHVSTTAFNQAVKRNLNRFPAGFRFQLTKEEHAILISQIVTSKREAGQETRGGYHKLPYAFTEQGIAMLSGILRSDVASAVSIRLMNTFVEMRRALASMVPMQSRLEAIERRQILTCELTMENPLRVEDVFGHSYAGLFDVLEREINKALPASAPLRRKFDSLSRRWMNADDNPRFAKDPSLYVAFNQKLNTEIRRLFQKLGYDGFVYRNELEDGESAADSYCVFDDSQVAVLGEEMIQYAR